MHTRILDLDGSVASQGQLAVRYQVTRFDLRTWGPRLRLACGQRRFRSFERALASLLGDATDPSATLTFCGSGDFHHVSLALLRRQTQPFNLLVLDNHPDWMRGVPLLHCGTWLYHAARSPLVQEIFHVGGDVDFDNAYRWMAPWDLLRSGRITIFPARRRYRRGPWRQVPQHCLRSDPQTPATAARLEQLVRPFRTRLAQYPLYVSVDKDVLTADEAVVNWDSGHLTLAEVKRVLDAFLSACEGRLAAVDTVGDWSPVEVRGVLRRVLHLTEHPRHAVDPDAAAARNARVNLALLESLQSRRRLVA